MGKSSWLARLVAVGAVTAVAGGVLTGAPVPAAAADKVHQVTQPITTGTNYKPGKPAPAKSGSIPLKNTVKSAGKGPTWVQQPIIVRQRSSKPRSQGVQTRGQFAYRYSLQASAYVQAYRTKSKRRASKPDKLEFTVAIMTAQQAKQGRAAFHLPPASVSYYRLVSRRVSRAGLQSYKLKLKPALGRSLYNSGLGQLRRRAAVNIRSYRDTYSGTRGFEYSIGLNAPFTKKKLLTAKQSAKAIAAAKKNQRVMTGRALQSRSIMQQPQYISVGANNNTPFTQQVTWNPYYQCMYTGTGVTQPYQAQTPPPTTVGPNGTAWFITSNVTGSAENQLYQSWAQAGQPQMMPGYQVQTLSQDVQGAAMAGVLAAEKSAGSSITDPSTYSSKGAMTAVAGAGLSFLGTFIEMLINPTPANTCSIQVGLWGVTATAVGVGNLTSAPGQPLVFDGVVNGTPNTWAGGGGVGRSKL